MVHLRVNETTQQMYGTFWGILSYNRPAHPNLQLTKYLEVPNRCRGSFISIMRGPEKPAMQLPNKNGHFPMFSRDVYGTFEGFTS